MSCPEAVEVDNEIHCICGFTDYSGMMILCEYCRKWVHSQCYMIKNIGDEDDFMCKHCVFSALSDTKDDELVMSKKKKRLSKSKRIELVKRAMDLINAILQIQPSIRIPYELNMVDYFSQANYATWSKLPKDEIPKFPGLAEAIIASVDTDMNDTDESSEEAREPATEVKEPASETGGSATVEEMPAGETVGALVKASGPAAKVAGAVVKLAKTPPKVAGVVTRSTRAANKSIGKVIKAAGPVAKIRGGKVIKAAASEIKTSRILTRSAKRSAAIGCTLITNWRINKLKELYDNTGNVYKQIKRISNGIKSIQRNMFEWN